MHDRRHLEALLVALDASPRSLCRDQCGDWIINGRAGHVRADGPGFLLYVTGDFRASLDERKTTAGFLVASARTATTKGCCTWTGYPYRPRPI